MSRFDLNQYPLWTAIVTPLTTDGTVDYEGLAKLVAAQQAANNAIVLLGSTGEGLALHADEQQLIVEYVVGLNPTVPLMVAVGGYDLGQQTLWIEQCNKLPIDAFLLATPMYAKPGPQGQHSWFERLLDTAEHPCMIYNVPSRSGINLDVQTLGQLSSHENFWSIKEASGSLELFQQYAQACPGVAVYSGDDGLFPAQAQVNAHGLVSVCANAWPQATHNYVDFHLSHRNEPISQPWAEALDRLAMGAANPIPVKVLMYHLDQINTPLLRAPLTHLELESSEHLLAADEKISQWQVQFNYQFSAVNSGAQATHANCTQEF